MRVYIIGVAIFIAMDIISGLLKALYNNDFKSSIMRNGLFHKVGEVMVLALLYIVELESPAMGIELGLPLFKAGCGYVAFMEIGSVIENLRTYTPGIEYIIHKGGPNNVKENIPKPEQSDEQ